MNERTKESLSALLDNEADDLELRRILAQAHDDEVMEVWCRYHQIRAGMSEEESAWAHIDLREGIASRLDEELGIADGATPESEAVESANQANGEEPVKSAATSSRFPWWGGAAIAASVAFAVVFSVQTIDLQGNTVQQPQIVEQSTPQNAGTEVASSAGGDVVEFSEEHEQRLNAYLMKHAGNAALNGGRSIVPYARLTSYEPVLENPEAVAADKSEVDSSGDASVTEEVSTGDK
ncbi:hypothetical protein BTA51_24980 [Hahella sp. CCB-MM4]|uniref:sigma-E factor negative regulatory protein n=1 Tax=Hahella sp. (strain CCB-MM4) TaxID=1926491 RepID=UPI000B9B3389|nr:sigma-E factor negative regulatory protein [Hahella sp. CCB-MM4]OZG70624.1 hypothetical protein BTA51_24980 [Hahella sp. CCB-MM4]